MISGFTNVFDRYTLCALPAKEMSGDLQLAELYVVEAVWSASGFHSCWKC